jgi:hypothetical protein
LKDKEYRYSFLIKMVNNSDDLNIISKQMYQ